MNGGRAIATGPAAAATGGGGRPPGWVPRHGPNVRGLWTLYRKEVHRFAKVGTQTLLAPMVTTLLFLAVFSLALGGEGRSVGEVPFLAFLAPGLIAMAMVQNAFANTSSSIVIAKIQGSIVDLLMPPLGPGALTAAFALSGLTRGVVVAAAVWVAMLPFAPFRLHDPLAIVYFAVAGSLMLSLLGVLAGLWSDKFDQIAAVTNFVVTPLAFLSGTFYSVERLPEPWVAIAHLNPFFHMIDGFRYGFIGRADGSVLGGGATLLVVDLLLWGLVYLLFRRGWKLKP